MQYYLAIKRNEVLIHATTWINLEDMMVREKASHKRPRIVWLPLFEMSRIGKFLETEGRLVVAWRLHGGGGGVGSDC